VFQLRILGGFALQASSGTATPSLPQRRAEAALAVLAVCGDLGCTRERLIALLWPESDDVHSRHRLRDALSDTRRVLGADAVLSTGEQLRLNAFVVAADVLAFERARRSGHLEEAVQEYGGPLLDGFHLDDAPEFERWLDGERARLARVYAEALEQLALAAERAGSWGAAAGWWARAEEHDPLNSHVTLRHAQALLAIGDKANAIKTADDHVRRLREELDLEPDREVVVAIERLRSAERPISVHDPFPVLPRAPQPPAATDYSGTTENATAPLSVPQPPAVRARVRRWAPWAGISAAVALVGGALIVARGPTSHPAVTHHPRTAIAVLPFQNFGADTSYAYLAGALHDELLTQLAKVGALNVIGRTSVLAYARSTKRLSQIGAELGVGSIVEGSLQVVGNRLRVNVQLIDPETEAHLWAERYDRTLDDVFAVQSDIAQRIVAAVGATLTSTEANAIAAAPTQDAEAYQLYLQGRDYQRRAGWSRSNLESAQQLYERAVALDSTFALAHAALA